MRDRNEGVGVTIRSSFGPSCSIQGTLAILAPEYRLRGGNHVSGLITD